MVVGAVLGWTRMGSWRGLGSPAAVQAASARGLLGISCRFRVRGVSDRLAWPAVSPAPFASQQ